MNVTSPHIGAGAAGVEARSAGRTAPGM